MNSTRFKISCDTVVYVLSPPVFQTGGTEALHVLAYELRRKGIDARMFYPYGRKGEDPVGVRFKKFAVPYVDKILDMPCNVLIIPEAFPEFLKRYKYIQRGFWWLSVDNCWTWFREYRPFVDWVTVHLFEIVRWFFMKRRYDFHLLRNGCIDYTDDGIIHLAQSCYAYEYVKEKGVENVAYLMDYLGEEFLGRQVDLSDTKREDIVLYNPKKGVEFTKLLINTAPDVRFLPLENMTPSEVREWCSRAKVYIDFGAHPGKDRFPREAAIQGVAVITGRNGSAAYSEDIPIGDRYKFDRTDANCPEICDCIRDIFAHYNERIVDFAEYREFILRDKSRFLNQITEVFGA